MNARTFGTDDHRDEFAAKYGSADYAEVGRKILEAERTFNAARHAQEEPQVRVPSTPATAIRLASDKAVSYLVALAAERTPAVAEDAIRRWAASVDRALVSEKIDWLKTQPRVDLPKATVKPLGYVPAGRYAVTGNNGQTVFVRVDRPTEGQYKGRTFVKIQAGDDLHRVSWTTAQGLLAKILEDGVEAACIRYGHELEVCGRCGRSLTDEASRAAGIGPVCASKGW